MSEEKKTTPKEETEKKTPSQDTPEEKNVTPEKEAPKSSGTDPEEKKPKSSPNASDGDLKQLLSVDKTYRTGHTLYIIGTVLLLALILCHGAMFMLGIELFVGGTYASWAMFFLYVLPCIIMIIGLAMSAAAAKKHGVSGNDRVGMAFVAIGAALMITLGTLSLVSPSYRIYETEDLSLRQGQPLKIVKYIPTGLFQPTLSKLPGEYCVDIYRVDGIFARKLASKQIIFSGMTVAAGEDDNSYTLIISSVDGGGETIPFRYN